MSSGNPYMRPVDAAKGWFADHGNNYLGAGWTKSQAHVDTRFRVMLDVVDPSLGESAEPLDLGCGTSQLYEYMLKPCLEHRIGYIGLDLSPTPIARSREKFPDNAYYEIDCSRSGGAAGVRTCVISGIFTFTDRLSHDQMHELWRALVVERAFARAPVSRAG